MSTDLLGLLVALAAAVVSVAAALGSRRNARTCREVLQLLASAGEGSTEPVARAAPLGWRDAGAGHTTIGPFPLRAVDTDDLDIPEFMRKAPR